MRVDTAAGIHIGKVGCVQPWAVGMSCDQRESCFCGKGGKTLFYLVLMSVIFCGTGRVKHAVALQRTPDVADKEAVDLPAGRVPEVRLMPVCQVDTAAGTGIFQNQTFVEYQPRKQFLMALGIRTEIGIADSLGIAGMLLFHIMVAIKQMQPALTVKEGEKPKDIVVDLDYLPHVSVFPEFVSVPQLDIGVSIGIIIF